MLVTYHTDWMMIQKNTSLIHPHLSHYCGLHTHISSILLGALGYCYWWYPHINSCATFEMKWIDGNFVRYSLLVVNRTLLTFIMLLVKKISVGVRPYHVFQSEEDRKQHRWERLKIMHLSNVNSMYNGWQGVIGDICGPGNDTIQLIHATANTDATHLLCPCPVHS